jgi:Arc/MetJ-type ribon-helix-helix transcriptional regulator
MKERSSFTFDKETVKILDELMESGRFRNKSHAVEYAIHAFKDKENGLENEGSLTHESSLWQSGKKNGMSKVEIEKGKQFLSAQDGRSSREFEQTQESINQARRILDSFNKKADNLEKEHHE